MILLIVENDFSILEDFGFELVERVAELVERN